jgi:putative membrane protein
VVGPRELWVSAEFDPLVLVPLLLVHWLYGRGLARMWGRAGIGRGVRVREALAFQAGTLALVAALVWPLEPLAGTLFSAHMAQHMVLTIVAAPLLVAGRPAGPLWHGLPRSWRGPMAAPGRLWRRLSRPGPATVLQAAALWAWHVPALYEAALHDPLVHALEHAVFLLTAVAFWTAMADAARDRGPGAPIAAVWLLATAVTGGLLGAVLAWSPRPLYPHYEGLPRVWGLSALADQHLAGLIMWVPAGAVHVGAAVWLASRWLAAAARSSQALPARTALSGSSVPKQRW